MTIENVETTPCPHCGGEIRTAAKVCKHCKRPVGSAVNNASIPPAAFSPAPVLTELRAFVAARGVARPEQFDALVATHPAADAAVALGHLAAAGYITPVQVESLREGFRQQQESRAAGLLRVATERGLLTPAHAEHALNGFRGALFQQTIGEYVTSVGLLTAAQATELQRSTSLGGSVVVGAKAWWGRLSKTGRGVVYVVAGLPLLWLAWGALGLTVSAIRGEADIRVDGTMNGYGRGTATFTNRGNRAGSLCGRISVSCGRGSRSSASFCSGTVAPHETKQVPIQIPGMAQIRDYSMDWDDDCHREFVRESSGD